MDITGALYAISNTNSSGEQRSEASTLPVSAVEKHAYKYRNNYVIIKYTYAKNYIGELTASSVSFFLSVLLHYMSGPLKRYFYAMKYIIITNFIKNE